MVDEASRLTADIRKGLRLDALLTAARALVPQNMDTSAVTSLVDRMTPLVDRVTSLFDELAALIGRVTAQARELAGGASATRAGSAPRVRAPRASKPAKRERPGASAALPTFKLPRIDAAAFAGPLIAHLPRNRMVRGAGALILLAIVVVASPLDDAIGSALASRSGASPTVASLGGLERAPFEVPPLSAYGAAFESQGAYPTTTPSGTVEWVVALRNTGSAGWYRGIEGAQAALAMPDGTGVAVQSTPYVGPGQVGWFVVHFRARAELGTYTVQLLPRIDGRGPLADLGVFAVVTVAKNP